MGNVLRIEDQTVSTLYFANQRMDGHREFTYDSLYRLTSATGLEGDTPHLLPGLPAPVVPIDPSVRFNYTQLYTYDSGHNLTQLRHVREGNNHTQALRIAPHSNRGVRWTVDDPEPDFDALFDAHGNPLYLQRGAQPLVWNARDQLSRVTLLKRDNGMADDDETYLYSLGERVSKTHITASTRHETRYLPDLEIRTSSHGEQLHIITFALAHGSVRCLHWEAGQPDGIEADQLRYNLDDHLGSSTLELDREGALISLEHYYPFGGTSWQAARSRIEVDYKTLRYSGKELDASGLYYYGARYYPPWLQRWLSPDPAGTVDGLNLYGFVGNNPMTLTDDQGLILETQAERDDRKAQAAADHEGRKKKTQTEPGDSQVQGHPEADFTQGPRSADPTGKPSLGSGSRPVRRGTCRRSCWSAGHQLWRGHRGGHGGRRHWAALRAHPVSSWGAALGFTTSKGVSIGLDYALERLSLSAAVNFKTRKLDPNRIVKRGEYKHLNLDEYAKAKGQDLLHAVTAPTTRNVLKAGKEAAVTGTKIALKASGNVTASEIGAAVGTVLGTIEIIHEIRGANRELSEEKIARADEYINGMIEVLNAQMDYIDKLFNKAELGATNTYQPLEKAIRRIQWRHASKPETSDESHDRSTEEDPKHAQIAGLS
nr:hypothetical protein GCM10020185_51590 [Pseudomonas brassicacearum subsp. brassicacearum]